MADLKTTYLGLELKSPLVASASALSKKLEHIKQMEDAGLGAVVLYSLFEEEIIHDSLALDYFLTRGTESFAEAITYFPELEAYNTGPENYLKLISRAKEAVKIPIIGSLNGVSTGGWIKYAKMIEEAGADALELNLYFVPPIPICLPRIWKPPSCSLSRMFINPSKYRWQSSSAPSIPVCRISPRGRSAPAPKGLVLFNRFYQPNLDINKLEGGAGIGIKRLFRSAAADALDRHSV